MIKPTIAYIPFGFEYGDHCDRNYPDKLFLHDDNVRVRNDYERRYYKDFVCSLGNLLQTVRMVYIIFAALHIWFSTH